MPEMPLAWLLGAAAPEPGSGGAGRRSRSSSLVYHIILNYIISYDTIML